MLLELILNKLSPEERSRIIDELSRRIDESGSLHIRLDKQKAFEGKVSLDGDEPIKVEIHFKIPSSSKESIIEMVRTRIDKHPDEPAES